VPCRNASHTHLARELRVAVQLGGGRADQFVRSEQTEPAEAT